MFSREITDEICRLYYEDGCTAKKISQLLLIHEGSIKRVIRNKLREWEMRTMEQTNDQ